MSELRDLINDRLGLLQISLRQAAARSQGKTTATTLSRLALGKHTGKITADTIAGIALALDLPMSAVRAAAEKDTTPASWLEMSEKTSRELRDAPERLRRIMEVAEREMLEHRLEQRAKVKEARPLS